MALKAHTTPQPAEAAARPPRGSVAAESAAGRFFASLQLLARTRRMYQKDHPKIEESLFAAERSLRDALGPAAPVAVRLEGGAFYFRGRALEDPRGELRSFAEELVRRGISALTFRPETHTGELMAFLELVDGAPATASSAQVV